MPLHTAASQVRAAEAVAKLRTSVGLRVDKVLGPGVYNAVEGEAVLCGKLPASLYLCVPPLFLPICCCKCY